MPKAVHIQDLSYAYGERKALQGISFDIEAGKLFGLVGPNGGGKTTLFKILSTQLKPGSGTLSVYGEDVVKNPAAARRRLGVVFQAAALDKKLSVEENLRSQGWLYGLSGAGLTSAIEEVLVRFALTDRAKERVEKLSGGLMRRVEIAKSLLHSPDLLLLDEPTVGLDPLVRQELWTHIRALIQQKRMTVLLTTHLLDEAEACDALALLDQGKIVAEGTPLELRSTLGANVITLSTEDAESLAAALKKDYSYPITVTGKSVRLSGEPPAPLATELFSKYQPLVKAVSLGKPTLEDLFIQKTGRGLSEVNHA